MSEDPFIVQDDSTQHQKRRRKTHIGGISEHVVDEAREVFGVDEFNIDEFYEEDEEEEELEGDEELLDEEEGEEGMTERRRPKVRSKKETLMSSIEPSELDKGFVGASDKRILFEDKPERFQVCDRKIKNEQYPIFGFKISIFKLNLNSTDLVPKLSVTIDILS